VIAGGSIAAVTAAETLRLRGFDGDITVLSEESQPPYTRVPLSKGILAGFENPDTAALPALGADVMLRLNTPVARLLPDERRVLLADREEVPYDGLIIATGARARRLSAPTQTGEHVLRTIDDAAQLAHRIAGARSVLVVGAGFLGMEIASTCAARGLDVTVVDRAPPLRRLLGGWLAQRVVHAARDIGVTFVHAPNGVRLLGDPEITGVDCGDRVLNADVIVSAAGDVANTEWLTDSGLTLAGGIVVDEYCLATPHIAAAGDVAVTRDSSGTQKRCPHWTNAVHQGMVAATSLLEPPSDPPRRHDPHFWTEQFGLNIKYTGAIPTDCAPIVLAGEPPHLSGLFQWHDDDRAVAAASVNHPIPIIKLKKLARPQLPRRPLHSTHAPSPLSSELGISGEDDARATPAWGR
nr:FAD-dependent oxidoreductase [Actinomycetota bacterium]